MFKQHLVSGLSLSRPKACGVPGLFMGLGDSRLGGLRGQRALPLGWPPFL